MDTEQYFTCEDCGYEIAATELCCGDYLSDGQIIDGHCKSCCASNHRGNIYDGKMIAGGTFERCE